VLFKTVKYPRFRICLLCQEFIPDNIPTSSKCFELRTLDIVGWMTVVILSCCFTYPCQRKFSRNFGRYLNILNEKKKLIDNPFRWIITHICPYNSTFTGKVQVDVQSHVGPTVTAHFPVKMALYKGPFPSFYFGYNWVSWVDLNNKMRTK